MFKEFYIVVISEHILRTELKFKEFDIVVISEHILRTELNVQRV